VLVLTRRPGESIIIGNGIKLTVVSVGPGRVKIGIEAPPTVRIDREEIHARIQQEQSTDVLEAVSSGKASLEGDLATQNTPNTMIASGAETGILHNRIADRLPAASATTSPPGASGIPPPVPVSKLSEYRLPRKPR